TILNWLKQNVKRSILGRTQGSTHELSRKLVEKHKDEHQDKLKLRFSLCLHLLYIRPNQLSHIPRCKMENLRRHFRKKKDSYSVIGRVKRNGHCKKHPKHNQSPGVCSLCLREKLAQLSSYNSRPTPSSIASSTSSSSLSSYSSSYYSSASSSSSASPMHCFCFAGEAKSSSSSLSVFLLSGNHGMVKGKCTSLDIVQRRGCKGDADHGDHRSACENGFWFKLLHCKSKKMEKYYTENDKLIRSASIKV
ncbi:hypothetical protein V8G54_037796, partial [Vigna mungo]